MTDSARRRRVDEVCHSALERDAVERAAFVAAACGDDSSLRREVEALLAHAQTAEGFLAAPVGVVAARVLGESGGMALVGRQISSYTILSHLGTGGMGEVYRAHDAKLGRDVAIKILPRVFTSDPERLARFDREARMLAALNHPHIAAIYGVEDVDGTRALILELVEGPTLADRLAKGPMPVSESLTVARQIAEALDAAHEKGIIHRDLKPANIKIAPEGVVKVLDFGLAKAASADGSTPDLTQSPTVTVGGTRAGVILGTAAYMSPEQARGHAVDKRTDIWAFGCVLYEMLTGRPAFAGDTVSDTIARILERDPDWRALPMKTPVPVRRLLQRSIEKDTKRRLRDIGEARIAIDDSASGSTALRLPDQGNVRRRRWVWGFVGGSLALGLGLGWTIARFPQSSAQSPVLTLTVNPPAGTEFGDDSGVAISPDGRLLAFVARSAAGARLWVRPLNSLNATELPGTDQAVFPFWSPDSRSLGFFAAGKLKRIDLGARSPTVICNVGGGRGGTWNEQGIILFNSVNDGPLFQVSAAGGTPEPLTVLDTSQHENSHRWPQFLPGGRRFLYYVRVDEPAQSGVYLATMDRPKEKVRLVGTVTNGIYVPDGDHQSGHVFWVRDGMLMAQAFEPAKGQLTGEIFTVAQDVAFGGATALAAVSVSANGTIVYRETEIKDYQLTWFGRDGKSLGALGQPGAYVGPRISPDGRRVAVRYLGDIWQMELARGILTRVTFDGGGVVADPIWSPDGLRIEFSQAASGSGNPTLYSKSASGTGSDLHLIDSRDTLSAQDWSADGRFLIYVRDSNDLSSTAQDHDLWLLPLNGEQKPAPFLTTPFHEGRAQFSPDGKWIAYTSDESGRNEVYVQSFPASGSKWQVSSKGGDWVRWRKDGKELFYVAPDRQVLSVAVRAVVPGASGFGIPNPLFVLPVTLSLSGAQQLPYSYDVMPDGQRFLALAPAVEQALPMTVILNWQAASSTAGK